MYSTTNQKGMQAPVAEITARGENRMDARKRHRVEAIFGHTEHAVVFSDSFSI
jgi:hypothetical protein